MKKKILDNVKTALESENFGAVLHDKPVKRQCCELEFKAADLSW